MDSRLILSYPCLVLLAAGPCLVADIQSELAIDEVQGRDDLSRFNKRRSLNKSHHWFGACLRWNNGAWTVASASTVAVLTNTTKARVVKLWLEVVVDWWNTSVEQ